MTDDRRQHLYDEIVEILRAKPGVGLGERQREAARTSERIARVEAGLDPGVDDTPRSYGGWQPWPDAGRKAI